MTYCSEKGDAIAKKADDKPEYSAYDMSEWCCNCGSAGLGPDEHGAMCSLHASWEFRNGWYVWDAPRLELIDVVQAIEDGIIPGDPNTYTHSDTTITTGGATYRDDEDDDVRYRNWWDDDIEVEKYEKKTTVVASYTDYGGRTKCSHFQQPYKLPSGVVVYASTFHRDRLDDPLPDLGIYMDGLWMPDCIAFHVGCPDWGVPLAPVDGVLYVAREGIRAAAEGKRVEVGCVGGHGRTGLMLAIMSLLSMRVPDADAAIDRVRDLYCIEAIESRDQEWYIAGIACQLQGKPWPPKPKPLEYPKWVKDKAGKWYKIPYEGAEPVPLVIDKKTSTVMDEVATKKAQEEQDKKDESSRVILPGSAPKGSAKHPWNNDKAKHTDPYYPANTFPPSATIANPQGTQPQSFVGTRNGIQKVTSMEEFKEELINRKNEIARLRDEAMKEDSEQSTTDA